MLWAATRTLFVLTVIVGCGYTALITAIGALAFPHQVAGSPLTTIGGAHVGSSHIGQSFSAADGRLLPQYFQPRPSTAGAGYDGSASSGSNLGPESPHLVAAIHERRAAIAAFNDVAPERIPADALTASGSGLDPDISPAYAQLQAPRVAAARGLELGQVEALVVRYSSGPDLGFIGDATVNVVELNLALDESEG